jgi:hypothetical protein
MWPRSEASGTGFVDQQHPTQVGVVAVLRQFEADPRLESVIPERRPHGGVRLAGLDGDREAFVVEE